MSKIDIRHLDFYYGAHRALADVNSSLADRSITAFIGPSGTDDYVTSRFG